MPRPARLLVSRRARLVAGAVAATLGAGVLVASLSSPGAAAAPQERSVEAGFDASSLLVTWKAGASSVDRAKGHRGPSGTVSRRFTWMNTDVVRFPVGVDVSVIAEAYRRNPLVTAAEPNWEMKAQSIPNDARFASMWGLHQTNGVDINAPEAWDAAFGAGNFPSSGGTVVGIVDSGIYASHQDLAGKVVSCARATAGWGSITVNSCADDNGHGTHVAGTIAALTNNSVGVAGVAPNARLAIFKALRSSGYGTYADIIAGINWLRTTGGARIISMSLGGPRSFALDDELAAAENAGILLVAAAGNDGNSLLNYPAAHPDVMSVGAVSSNGAKASFSNCNTDVEIAAPGVAILSTIRSGGYGSMSGTSMATPHVAGAAALVMSTRGTTAAQTRSLLVGNTTGSGGCNSTGRLDLAKALGVVVASPSPTTSPSTSPSSSPSSSPSTSPSTSPSPTPPPATTPPSTVTPAVAGTVRGDGLAPVAGATVTCSGVSATTAANGTYRVAPVPAGSMICTATATGYRTAYAAVSAKAGQTATANFTLRR